MGGQSDAHDKPEKQEHKNTPVNITVMYNKVLKISYSNVLT